MMLFPVYALLVWYFALKWRRMWLGFVSVAVGTVGVHVIAVVYLRLGAMLGISRIESMLILLYPFAGMVALVGMYLALLPRTVEEACRRCGYSLRGLEERAADGLTICPECGARHAIASAHASTCRSCGDSVRPSGRSDWLCKGCGLHHIEQKPRPSIGGAQVAPSAPVVGRIVPAALRPAQRLTDSDAA